MGLFALSTKHTEMPVEMSPDYKRMDQMNTVPMRMGWDPEIMKFVEKFLAMRMGETRRPNDPGFTDIDVALARGAWCLEEDAGGPMSGAGVGGQAFYSWEGDVFPTRTEFGDPAEASRVIKHMGKFLGASLVGIADYDERWVYTHSYHPLTKAHEPIVFPFEPKSVIVMAIEMDYEAMRTASTYISSAAVGKGYGQIAITAHRVAAAVRALGYHAVPCGNDTAMSVPLAIMAGLGELSRIGILITPEFGPRVRLCKVFTDLPLQADQPVTFGVQEFCKTCLKCAEVCPAHVISTNREPSFTTVTISNNPGAKKWYNKVDNCFKYWSAKVDCAACIAACPYNKKNDLTHQVGLRIAQTPARGLLRKLDELLGYGRTFDKPTLVRYWSASGVDNQTYSTAAGREPSGGGVLAESTPVFNTPRETFAMLSDKFAREPAKLAGMNTVIQFKLKGDQGGLWFISVVNGQGEVGEGEHPSPGCTLTMPDKDLPPVVAGKLDPRMAVLSGRISVKGDVTQLLKIKKLFG